eukprot:gene3909-15229_t
MSFLKSRLFSDIPNDRVIELEDYETSGLIANSALILMVRGVISDWKQPLAYYLVNGSCPPNKLKDIISEALLHLESMEVAENSYKNCPKLKEKHINLNGFSERRIKLASQVLSHSVAAGIYTKVSLQSLPNEAVEIGVSFDSSWQKRSHFSHNGLTAVIDLETFLLEDEEQIEERKEKHARNCSKNYNGTANAMEIECAKRL